MPGVDARRRDRSRRQGGPHDRFRFVSGDGVRVRRQVGQQKPRSRTALEARQRAMQRRDAGPQAQQRVIVSSSSAPANGDFILCFFGAIRAGIIRSIYPPLEARPAAGLPRQHAPHRSRSGARRHHHRPDQAPPPGTVQAASRRFERVVAGWRRSAVAGGAEAGEDQRRLTSRSSSTRASSLAPEGRHASARQPLGDVKCIMEDGLR